MSTLFDRSLFHGSNYALFSHKRKRRIGMRDEIRFWDQDIAKKYVTLNGRPPSTEGLEPAAADTPLQGTFVQLLAWTNGPVLRILNVGSGPFTRVGKTIPGRTVEVTAVDPLSEEYKKLYTKHAVRPPVIPVEGAGETLRQLFPADHFHFAHANNCLDHGFDPVESVTQMVQVVKPGGYVYLRHEVNVAETAGYMGMHQWNFHLDGNGDFIIRDKKRVVNMNKHLGSTVRIASQHEGDFLVTTIHRSPR